jgi:hypothetical protein
MDRESRGDAYHVCSVFFERPDPGENRRDKRLLRFSITRRFLKVEPIWMTQLVVRGLNG